MNKLPKFVICILLVLISTSIFAKGAHKISRPVGTNLTIEDDDDNKNRLVLNFETDSYVYNQTEYINPSIMYSTGGWDIGMISQNIVLTEGPLQQTQNFENDTYFNLNKTIKHSDVFDNWDCGTFCDKASDMVDGISTTIGTQTGLVLPLSGSVNPGYVNSQTLHEFYFIDHDVEVIKNRFSVHYGNYYVNQALSTTSSYIGYMVGSELVVYPKLLKLSCDFYSGRSNASGTIAEVTWIVNKHLEFFVGAGLSTPNSGNYDYWISGVNIIQIFEK